MPKLIFPLSAGLVPSACAARGSSTASDPKQQAFVTSVDVSTPGAGKLDYSCPGGGIEIHPGDDINAAVDAAPPGATLCIYGQHRVTSTLVAKSGQTWIGVDGDARISGAQPLADWQPAQPGVWVYRGQWAILPNQPNQCTPISPGVDACYLVSTCEDDVFYNDQRMMRGLRLDQLTGNAIQLSRRGINGRPMARIPTVCLPSPAATRDNCVNGSFPPLSVKLSSVSSQYPIAGGSRVHKGTRSGLPGRHQLLGDHEARDLR